MKILYFFFAMWISAASLFAGFTENKGQFPAEVLFLSSQPDCFIWVAKERILFEYKSTNIDAKRAFGSVLELFFDNASPFKLAKASPKGNSRTNYFIGASSVTDVKEFDTLIFASIYQNIDLRLYFSANNFAYDFILHPGANPNDIRVMFDGQDRIDILDEKLLITTPFVSVRHERLNAFYDVNSKAIPATFDYQNGAVKVNLEAYNANERVIIDPVVFSTFVGGSDYDYCRSMAKDSFGNIVIAGSTASANFPTKVGSFDTTFAENDWGFYDVFVSKFDSLANNLIFSTYIGGYGDDYCESIAIDQAGNLHLTGYTLSLRNYPIKGVAIDSIDKGGFDVFFSKLSADGNQLLHSTLIGGSSDDFAQAIALDRFGGVYITGYTKSADFKRTPTAYDTTSNGVEDAFALKLNANSYSLAYSTLIGGPAEDYGQSIAVDNIGQAVIGGLTRSTFFPTTQLAFDRTFSDSVFSSSNSDGFITKLNTAGTGLVFSSFIGGKGKDAVYALILDEQNNIYATGLTESENFPITSGAYNTAYNNRFSGNVYGDVFISKIKHSGDSVLASTFFGARGTERANAIGRDQFGNIYITGSTNSSKFPTTSKAFMKAYADTASKTDAFASKFSGDLSTLLYSTIIGGKISDVGNAILSNNDLSFYVGGWTESYNFPTTANAFQSSLADTLKSDAFLVHIMPNLIDIVFENEDGTKKVENICIGDSVWIGSRAVGGIGQVRYSWKPAPFVSNPDSAFTFVNPPVTTAYELTVSDDFGNSAKDTIIVNVLPVPFTEIFGARMVLQASEVEYFAPLNSTSDYEWTAQEGTIIAGQGSYKVKVLWKDSTLTGKLTVVETNIGKCSDTAHIVVNIGKNFSPVIDYDSSNIPCAGDTVRLDAGEGYRFYLWSTGAMTRAINVTTNGDYWVSVTDSAGFGGVSDTINIQFTPSPVPIIYGQAIVKPGNLYSYITDKHEGSIYTWIISGGTIISGDGTDSITVRWNNTKVGSLLIDENTANGCHGRSEILMIDIGGNFKPKIRILGSSTLCIGDSVLLDAGYGYVEYTWNNGKKSRFISVATVDSFFCYVRDAYGFAGWTDTIRITHLERPIAPSVKVFGNQFTCEEDSLPIQWYFNSQVIPGADKKTYIADIPGIYKACIRGDNGCQACSELIYYLVSVSESSSGQYLIYPNPTEDLINLRINNFDGCLTLKIHNLFGEVVYESTIIASDNTFVTIDIADYASGIYIVSIDNGIERKIEKIIKK